MPILYVCSRENDYLQDLTYAGLAEVLGKEQVVEFPYHWSFHRKREHFWSRRLRYPKNLGLVIPARSRPPHPAPRGRSTCQGEREGGVGIERVKEELQKKNFELAVLAGVKPDAL